MWDQVLELGLERGGVRNLEKEEDFSLLGEADTVSVSASIDFELIWELCAQDVTLDVGQLEVCVCHAAWRFTKIGGSMFRYIIRYRVVVSSYDSRLCRT